MNGQTSNADRRVKAVAFGPIDATREHLIKEGLNPSKFAITDVTIGSPEYYKFMAAQGLSHIA